MVAGEERTRAERPAVGLLVLDADDPDASGRVDLAAAAAWLVVLRVRGIPVGTVRLPSPGPGAGRAFVRAALLRHADEARARWRLEDSLRARLGVPERRYPIPTVSVVVCTHGRPASLARLLDAFDGLDPAPDEILVVDNAPHPGEDCRDLAEAHGFAYLREDRKGLNNARSAGVAAARSELVAFTDDDCAPPPDWLSALPELFDDRTVAVVTGPAFPFALDSESKLRFEKAASFSRGFARRRFDWTVLSPVDATRTGAGANMIFRRSVLEELGDVFPAELDAGTPTRSGGDMYALYHVLATGRRVLYDPGTYTFHDHREGSDELRNALHGYGVGLGSTVTKLLVEERELAGLRVFGWLVRAYARERMRELAGAVDRDELEAARQYLRGAIEGPRAWRTARAAAPSLERRQTVGRARPWTAPLGKPCAMDATPSVSVVVTTHRRPEALAECLGALAAQEPETPPFEVVVADDTPASERRRAPVPNGLPAQVVATDASGAAAARNAGARKARGEVVLFLDDDLVPDPALVRRHAQRHGPEVDIVIGYSPPRPVRRNLLSSSVSLWWEDHYRAKRDSAAFTFRDMLSGNMSISRAALDRIGLFDDAFGRFRREDWEWGMRAFECGARIAYEEEAVALHRFELTSRGRLAVAEREGRGDALLLERFPFALPSVPAANQRPPGGLRRQLLFQLLLRPAARRAAAAVLDLAERARARRTWSSWFDVVQRAAYEDGFRRGRGRSVVHGPVPPVDFELDSSAPIPPPGAVVPALELKLHGRTIARLPSGEGQWGRELASAAAAKVPKHALPLLDGRPSADGAPPPEPVELLLTPRSVGEAATRLREPDWWEEFDRAVRASERDAVALALPEARVSLSWRREAAVALEGTRVALVLSAGLPPTRAPEPLKLIDRSALSDPVAEVGSPPQALVVRRDAYLVLGGVDRALARLGALAPVLDLVRRTLDAGYLVGQQNSHGIVPAGAVRPARSRLEWRRWQALGGLAARDARRGPVAAALGPAARRVAAGVFNRRPRQAAGIGAAFALGFARGGVGDPEEAR
jgi:glycosyltransferase involved in cell wall biosynthesis